MNRHTLILSIWICLGTLFSYNYVVVDSFVGLNWGRMATQKLVPSMVVDLLLQNGIPQLKLFSPSEHVLPAFANSTIGLSVMFQEHQLRRINNSKDIYDWIGKHIKEHTDKFVDIRYLYVGNEPFSRKYKQRTFDDVIYYLREARNALDRYNLTHIKTTTAHFTDILTNVTKPSEGDFRDDIKDLMINLLKFLKETNAPLVINIFPIYIVSSKKMPVEFAFFDENSGYVIKDGPHTYKNIFTFTYDTLVSALIKAGYPDMEILVGQIGWPTDGYSNASPKNAERYHRGLLRYLKRNEGTPLRPNKTIDVFITGLSDENKILTSWGEYQRHWGIYRHDGSPKYKIDFSMKDRDIEPTTAKGTVKMPNRWCIYNESNVNDDDKKKLKKLVTDACKKSDCTFLSPGATCDNLNYSWYASFAFNMFFQMNNQRPNACSFDGLGYITVNDPSTPKCKFPIEILSLEVVDNGAWEIANLIERAGVANPMLTLWLTLSALSCIIGILCFFMWY